MFIPGGMEKMVLIFATLLFYMLPLAFAVFVGVFLVKTHNIVVRLEQKIDQLEQKHTD